MIKAHRITNENVAQLSAIYARFSKKARSEYQWAHEPVDFDQFMRGAAHKIVEGYWIEDTDTDGPVGFMLYRREDHRAIEINVIYSEIDDHKIVLDRVMRKFIADIQDTEGWDVVSYAMLGVQEHFIRTITWYGFKPMGQAILKFDMLDAISIQILKQQQCEPLGPEYTFDTWKPEYAGDVAQCVFESFESAADSRWDPRFRSLLGARKVVGLITAGVMGTHIPACTSVVLKNGSPVGFCFLVQAGPMSGNIPLIGVNPSEKGKNLGTRLLKMTLAHCIDEMLGGRIAMIDVNTTMDTDNIPAIKMYRRMGFREETNYPHVYQSRESIQSRKVGQWC
jgi:ribosomal protein S18 acetylase RimI-like enzyme